jgi:hypothetical protein
VLLLLLVARHLAVLTTTQGESGLPRRRGLHVDNTLDESRFHDLGLEPHELTREFLEEHEVRQRLES